MKRLAFAIGVLALGFAASTPARADFAVVKFASSGWCRVWTDTSVVPPDGKFLWFRDWHHWHMRYLTWEAADAHLHRAINHHRCVW